VAEIAPNIDYTSRDFDGLKRSLLDYARVAFPDWAPGSEGDFGVLLVELLAYTGDVLSYYVDRAQNESYLPTASQRASILQIAELVGYRPGTGAPATGSVTLKSADGSADVTVPAGTRLATDFASDLDTQIIFETDVEVVVPGSGGTIAVAVTEGETKKDDVTGNPLKIAESTGLPDQTIRLPHPKVYVETIQVYVAGEEWLAVDHLLDADAGDRVFETFYDDQGYSWIRFGDGLNGAIPTLGLEISAKYRVGVGAAGNLAAGRVISLFDALAGVSVEMSGGSANLSTSTAMTGGADPESNEQIRINAPRAFHSQQRAVTLDDYKNFAVAVPGVSRANAVANFFSSVTVYIVGPDGGAASTALTDAVQTALRSRSLAGVSVSVGAPTFIPVNIGATGGSEVAVEVWPTYSRTAVQYQVEQALKSLLSFENVDLGMKLVVAEVYRQIMEIEGVRYVTIPLMARSDAAQSGTADIQFKPWELPKAGNLVVTSSGGIG
jgi:hypothetical protein